MHSCSCWTQRGLSSYAYVLRLVFFLFFALFSNINFDSARKRKEEEDDKKSSHTPGMRWRFRLANVRNHFKTPLDFHRMLLETAMYLGLNRCFVYFFLWHVIVYVLQHFNSKSIGCHPNGARNEHFRTTLFNDSILQEQIHQNATNCCFVILHHSQVLLTPFLLVRIFSLQTFTFQFFVQYFRDFNFCVWSSSYTLYVTFGS